MIIKFNGGRGALLCEHCGAICATGDRIPKQYQLDLNHGDLVFCSDKCMEAFLEKMKRRSKVIKAE